MGGIKTTASMGAEGRSETWNFDPEKLTIPEKGSILHDAARSKNVSESFIENIMLRGVLEPVLIRKNGNSYEVIDGRQRVLAAREGNKRFRTQGIARRILVPAVTRRSDDALAYTTMIATNVHRRPERPMELARKLQEYLTLGNSEEAAANDFNCDLATIKRRAKLLDLDSAVQAAIDDDRVSVDAALPLVELSRDKQREELARMLANGTTHGAAGKQAGRTAAKGAGGNGKRKPPAKSTMRSIRFVRHVLKAAEDSPRAPATVAAVRDALRYVAGEIGLAEVESEVVREILQAAETSSGRKGSGA